MQHNSSHDWFWQVWFPKLQQFYALFKHWDLVSLFYINSEPTQPGPNSPSIWWQMASFIGSRRRTEGPHNPFSLQLTNVFPKLANLCHNLIERSQCTSSENTATNTERPGEKGYPSLLLHREEPTILSLLDMGHRGVFVSISFRFSAYMSCLL